jgi:Protein of unknown function (DUF2797)
MTSAKTSAKTHVGDLRKMRTRLEEPDGPVAYELVVGDELLPLNPRVGETIALRHTGTIRCTSCGRVTPKSYAQGFCYPCFRDAPEASPCIIRPELCEAHTGGGRDPAWEQRHHNQPHLVYLAVSSGLKVGVTRGDQIPTRWIDQGAWRCVVLAETPNRYESGRIEVALKEHVSDRTHWQKMLKNVLAEDLDLASEKHRLASLLPQDLQGLVSPDDKITELRYPVLEFPTKVLSQSFDKTAEITGTLLGIKGQYLLLDGGRVLNIRKHGGYEIEAHLGD